LILRRACDNLRLGIDAAATCIRALVPTNSPAATPAPIPGATPAPTIPGATPAPTASPVTPGQTTGAPTSAVGDDSSKGTFQALTAVFGAATVLLAMLLFMQSRRRAAAGTQLPLLSPSGSAAPLREP
jgi:hypothetical protein